MPVKMNAVEFDAQHLGVHYVSKEIPEITDNTDIIVQIAYAGVCGTDLHIIEGQFPAKNKVVLGHEMSGIVFKVPENCTTLSVGDKVAVNPNRSCNMCIQCRRDKFNLCVNNTALGIVLDGGWAQYCKIPIYLLAKLPNSIPLELGVLCEPLSCIVHALDEISPLEIGSTIVVLGAGIIGVLFCCVLHLLGHRNVYVSSPNIRRNKYIGQLNLGYECMTWNDIEEHHKQNPEWQIDICIDCSGNSKAMEQAIPLLRSGGKLVIFGCAGPNDKISVSPFDLYRKELTIIGVALNTASTFTKTINMMECLNNRKYLSYEKMGIVAHKLKDYQLALGELKKKGCTKVVFQVDP